jgi:hypothetical protein
MGSLSVWVRQSAPWRRELSLIGQSLIEKDKELLSPQWVERSVLSLRPPAQPALCKSACNEPKANAVITNEFERSAAPVSEDEESSGERIFRQLSFAKRCQPVDPGAEIDWLAGEENPKLRNQLDHPEFKLAGNRRRAG